MSSTYATGPDATPPGPGRVKLLVVALVLLLLGVAVALMLVLRDLDEERGLRQAGEQADKAARAAVVAMTSYDHSTIDADFAWVNNAGTAAFQEKYAEISEPIKELVVELKATAKGEVVASAPKVEDADHVTVLLFVDQTLTSESEAKPGLDQPRVTVSMVRQDGRWLVDDVELSNLTGGD